MKPRAAGFLLEVSAESSPDLALRMEILETSIPVTAESSWDPQAPVSALGVETVDG